MNCTEIALTRNIFQPKSIKCRLAAGLRRASLGSVSKHPHKTPVDAGPGEEVGIKEGRTNEEGDEGGYVWGKEGKWEGELRRSFQKVGAHGFMEHVKFVLTYSADWEF